MNVIYLRTFFVSYVLFIALCVIVIAPLWWQNRKRFPEIALWLTNYILQFIALLLVALRGLIPDLVSIVLGNFFIIGGTIILYAGLCRYVGRKTSQLNNVMMLAVFTLAHAYLTYVYPSATWRTINQSVALIYICSQAAWLMLHGTDISLRSTTRATGIVFAFFCLISMISIIVNLTVPETHTLIVSNLFGIFAVVAYQILFVALTFSLFLMVSRRLSIHLEREMVQREQEDKLMRLRLSLLEFAATHSLEEVLQKTLDEIGLLLESPVGFYHFVDEDQKSLTLQTWSTRTQQEFCKAEGKGMHYSIDQAGVWVDCVYQKRAVIHNDYYALPHRKGLPEGHAPVIRELVVPIIRSGKVMAILGIGNKPAYYTEKDADIVSYLADVAWEITRRKKAEEAAGKYAKDLKERLKEINCLYSISEIVQKKDITQEELFKECPSIIAQAYQFPEITVCRILIGDHEYRTDNFRQTQWSQSKTIKVNGEPVGLVEVCYLEERRKEYEGPFLVEERNLLEAVADILERYLEGKEAQDALKRSEEKYKQLAEVFPESIFEANMKGDVIYANPHGLKQFGVTGEDIDRGVNIFDYVSPEDRALVMERIQSRINGDDEGYLEFNAVKKDGSSFHALTLSVPITVDGIVVGIRGFIMDITERKQAEEQIKHMATHDLLTDLPSLRLAKDRLTSALNMARRYKKSAAVMFIDLDGFKHVNDTLGHDAGDYVLKQVAQRLLSCVRETDTVARVGGDEFLIIATEINHPDNAAQIAEKVIHTVSQPIAINGEQAVVGTSIGIALFPEHGDDMDKLIKMADEAMYKVKNAGKNNFCFVSNSI